MRVKVANANTGAVTINVNSLGVKSVKGRNGGALKDGDFPANATIEVIYDGTDFRLVGIVNSEVNVTIASNFRFFDSFMTPSQSVPDSTYVTPTIDAAIENGLVDSMTFSTSKIVVGVKDAGVWSVSAYVQYGGSGTNKSLRIHRNGASVGYSGSSRMAISQNGSGIPNDTFSVAVMLRLNAGDTVSIDLLHNVGSTVILTNGRFIAARIAP